MNIFVLDDCPVVSASYMCDKHIPKMIVESFQMLSTGLRANGFETNDLYRSAYIHHPCTKWAGYSADNWLWLFDHAEALLQEYRKRYGKIHKCEITIYQAMRFIRLPAFSHKGLSDYAQAMPDMYKSSDAIWSYRAYYLFEKAYFAKWEKGSDAPWWWSENKIYTEPLEHISLSA